ncbi:MAG TPA: carboxypeptidase-like regulatory domain-containing protein [Pyrinomonadaceae bacterium]|nr:carboxypeptidase-like regulatory domain-containing protein [Pyrinomonadaceae bacterium]
MNTKFPRFVCLLTALVAVVCLNSQRAAAQAATFTISGIVTDTTGTAMAGVMVIVVSDVAGTQFSFTDQTGKYVLTYAGGVSHRLTILPSKSGFIFNPLLTIFATTGTLSGDETISFTGTAIPPVVIITPPPILLTQENSLHSLALDSVTLKSEPFGVVNNVNFSTDQRTHLSLFAVNTDVLQGEPLSVVTAQAENSTGTVFPLTVEHFASVPNFNWLKQVVVKLPDELANTAEVSVSIRLRGVASNKVVVKLKP